MSFTGNFPSLNAFVRTSRFVRSSSKTTSRISGCRIWCFLTPSIFFRIAPILLPAPHEKHPGTVNCTIFSEAKAVKACDIRKTNTKKKIAVFFIISSTFAILNLITPSR
ncbi:MAG: hypothetical protein CVU72_01955 [Deltaproteobacteria bacterium HGW-Deltaproteobacteria-7]|nr:MAG: hypothetical protein CVU72_01955 [Deltaproteobacteria bacterium HGW-Deltaproteobacteria-7]